MIIKSVESNHENISESEEIHIVSGPLIGENMLERMIIQSNKTHSIYLKLIQLI